MSASSSVPIGTLLPPRLLQPPLKPSACFQSSFNRRHLFTTLVSIFTPSFVDFTLPCSSDFALLPVAEARGLFQMPPARLVNRYFLVRAGESEFDSFGIINTNPVAKTSVDSGLSEEGKKQTVRAAFKLKEMGACEKGCWIWPSITQRAYQAAEIIASVNGVNRRDFGWQQRYARFCGRVVVLSILSVLLYPFLCAWTVIGTLWFRDAKDCLPEEGQKWGFLIWLLFSYCALLCIAFMSVGKWLARRQAHLFRAQQGIPVSEYGVLVDMIRVPDWAFEAAGLETRGIGQDATGYHPGLFLTSAQREAVEALIQELPKFRLKAVPTDCSECPICLEEFHVGNEVRGMPCAHNFHVECIDEWLRLNVKCPRCRSSVFPNLDLSALSNLHSDTEQTSANGFVTNQQPSSLSRSGPSPAAHTENTAGLYTDTALDAVENGNSPMTSASRH